jgi:hypothetical protein
MEVEIWIVKTRTLKHLLKKYITETFMFGEGQLNYETPLFESGIMFPMGFIKLLAF